MSKLIIGIHGLANKPRKEDLAEYWKAAIAEGLRKNEDYDRDFDFDIVYWADLLYKQPLHCDANFDFDDLFNDEPYYEADASDLLPYRDGLLDELRAGSLDLVGMTIDGLKSKFGMDWLADAFLSRFLKDLGFYYDERRTLISRDGGGRARARAVLQEDLKTALATHRDRQIMLIAHSMGTIIAYDVLRDVTRESEARHAGLSIDHFVTIGSPLGLPHVRARIMDERNYEKKEKQSVKDVRTPTIVTGTWINFADKKDPVSLDVHLNDDYHENDSNVRVKDDLISNDYRKPDIRARNGATVVTRDPEGKANHHKSYGYLRAPEVSRHIRRFLTI